MLKGKRVLPGQQANTPCVAAVSCANEARAAEHGKTGSIGPDVATYHKVRSSVDVVTPHNIALT